MAIKGVFQAGSLLSGLGSTGTKLKEVQQRSKSTTTEMKRMTGQTQLLSKAMAMIGIAGFSALLMTTPQLAGSLAKIKYEMQMLAWSIGKHLKPAIDSVATILQGIRTGDWSTVKRGIEDLAESAWDLVESAGSVVIDVVFDKGTAEKTRSNFYNWVEEFKKNIKEKNIWVALWEGSKSFEAWLHDREPAIIKWCDKATEKFDKLATDLTNFVTPEWMKEIAREMVNFDNWLGRTIYEPIGIDVNKPIDIFGLLPKYYGEKPLGKGQTGIGHIPRTGMYKLHEGETVTMRGSTPHVESKDNTKSDLVRSNGPIGDLNKWYSKINKEFGKVIANLTNSVISQQKKETIPQNTNIDTWTKKNPYKSLIGDLNKSVDIFGRYHESYEKKTMDMEGSIPSHVEETMDMKGTIPQNTVNGPTNITLDFSGANINLASGIELNDFADALSNKIAEKQNRLSY